MHECEIFAMNKRTGKEIMVLATTPNEQTAREICIEANWIYEDINVNVYDIDDVLIG